MKIRSYGVVVARWASNAAIDGADALAIGSCFDLFDVGSGDAE